MPITLTGKYLGGDEAPDPLTPVLTLTWQDRQRSRLAAMLPNGKALAVILARGEAMQHGDFLCNEEGDLVLVQAAVEDLMKVTASEPYQLMRIVYHLANRHVRAMLTAEAAYIAPDSVLAEMIVRLGGQVEQVQCAFHPEGGAYSGQASVPHHHHHQDSEQELSADAAMGNIGEALSIAAHARQQR